jgi:signal transduction histidine kinase
MSIKQKIILISLIVGLLVWFFNALLDSYIFNAGSMWDMLYVGLTPMQIAHRIIILFSFVIFGFVLAEILNKLKNRNLEISEKTKLLDKRVKELNCLLNMSKLLEKNDLTIDETLNGIANLITNSLQYPEISCARIIYQNNHYQTSDFEISDIKRTYPLLMMNDVVGMIEVCYKDNKSEISFLKEEDELLRAVADRVGKIIERLWTRNELNKYGEKLRALTGYLHTSREKERISIAREIHDELGQVLTALKINLSLISTYFKNKPDGEDKKYLLEEIIDMQAIIDITIKNVRKIITSLRPEVLDNLGLIDALIWQTNEFEKNTGIRAEFKSIISNLELDIEKSTAIFRIYQESLTNIARHSGADEFIAELTIENANVKLNVFDNGKGIDVEKIDAKESFGLMGMKERAIICGGDFKVVTHKHQGTSIYLTIPIDKEVIQ